MAKLTPIKITRIHVWQLELPPHKSRWLFASASSSSNWIQ
jgi:hypothetical protein